MVSRQSPFWNFIGIWQHLSLSASPYQTTKMSLHSVHEQVSNASLFVLGTSLFLSYAIFAAIYRLFFHPLAKFHGPFWARLTVFPSWWRTRVGDRHIWLYEMQQHFGTW
jgi:hypothetical protein